ncbi:MAG TPA: hypothetical protein VK048_04455 [Atopostipes sp.]|nr:hypothetical protein [Atopostipes sp.]
MEKEKSTGRKVSLVWLFTLPLLGVVHRLFVLLGWLQMGSWLNFIMMLFIPVVWIYIILQETDEPFAPLFFIGFLSGLLVSITELIYWLITREPLGPADTNWSLDDLLGAINQLLLVIFPFIGHIMLGLLTGAIAGFIGKRIVENR